MLLFPRIVLLYCKFMEVSNVNTEISQYQQVIFLLYMLINIVYKSSKQMLWKWGLYLMFSQCCAWKNGS